MDTATAAFDFIHAEPARPSNDGLRVADEAGVLSPRADSIGPQEVVVSLFPGTYAADYVYANNSAGRHWSAGVPYIVAGICAVLLYLVV